MLLCRAVFVCGANEEACRLFQKLDIIAAGPGRLSPASNRHALLTVQACKR